LIRKAEIITIMEKKPDFHALPNNSRRLRKNLKCLASRNDLKAEKNIPPPRKRRIINITVTVV